MASLGKRAWKVRQDGRKYTSSERHRRADAQRSFRLRLMLMQYGCGFCLSVKDIFAGEKVLVTKLGELQACIVSFE